MNNNFVIKIVNQQWLDEEYANLDLCSHGEIHLNVGGQIITQPGVNEEWGISESALALLRTIEKDYVIESDYDEGLIYHGCGCILMLGCPISIHWNVKHRDEQVILSDFVKFTTTNPDVGDVRYPGLEVKISKEEYRRQIISFALEAKKLFENSEEKQITDEFDQKIYEDFWEEYNELLTLK